MTISRRSLLALFTAATGSAAAGVKPAALAKVGALPLPPEPFWETDLKVQSPEVPTEVDFWSITRDVRQKLRQQMSQYTEDIRLPPHIANKRSWSPSVKHTAALREYIALREATDRLENRSTWEEAFAFLTGGKK